MIVVDGSESWLWHRVDAAFGTGVLHLRVDPTLAFLNGKVAGVTTGVQAASHEFVVIAACSSTPIWCGRKTTSSRCHGTRCGTRRGRCSTGRSPTTTRGHSGCGG